MFGLCIDCDAEGDMEWSEKLEVYVCSGCGGDNVDVYSEESEEEEVNDDDIIDEEEIEGEVEDPGDSEDYFD